MFKKILLATSLIILVISGCTSPKSLISTPKTFTVLYNDRKDTPFDSSWLILQEYQKRENVTLDVSLGDDADYNEAITLTLDSGNIPDIILKAFPDSTQSYASTGLLLPFSDYEKQMPNFMAYIKKQNLQGELDKLRLEDGKYYILPGFQRRIQVQQWIYRRDLFEKNGLPMPKTYEELFNTLVTLKQLYPDSTPITASWGGAHLFAMMGAGYGIPAGWAGTSYYNRQADRWQYSPATENFKAFLTFLSRCYAAGLLDPATFTQSNDDFTNKRENGQAIVTVTWITSGFDTWNKKLKENGFPDGEWAALPVLESTMGIKALPPVNPFRKGLVVPASVVNKPNFNDLLKFLDWAVYSDEGMTLTTWGVEDVTYKNTSEGKVLLPEIKSPKNPDGTILMGAQYGLEMLFNLNENEEFENYKKPAEIVAFLDMSLKNNETLDLNPRLVIDPNSIEAIRLINEKLDPYIAESTIKFITGELSVEKDWNTYISTMDNLGYKTIEDLWNAAWLKTK